MVRKAAESLKISFVPYQLRHSGASWDVARSYRNIHEVQRRGLWKTNTSVARYEKHGRMIAEYEKLDAPLRVWLEARHQDLEQVIVHNKPVVPILK